MYMYMFAHYRQEGYSSLPDSDQIVPMYMEIVFSLHVHVHVAVRVGTSVHFMLSSKKFLL